MGQFSLKRLLTATMLIGAGLGTGIKFWSLTMAEYSASAFYGLIPVPIAMIGFGLSLLIFKRSPTSKLVAKMLIALLCAYAMLLAYSLIALRYE